MEILFGVSLCRNKMMELQGNKILLFIFKEFNEHFCNIIYYSFVIAVTVVTLTLLVINITVTQVFVYLLMQQHNIYIYIYIYTVYMS
jgi:hypothetical protein